MPIGLSLDRLGSGHTHFNAAPNVEISGIGGGASGEVRRVIKRVLKKSAHDVDLELELDEDVEAEA